jgi:E3 ubiquitin-protein ligase SIAH1
MTSTKGLDWDLLEELECPVCLEYMASPIEMCENRHNICSSCKERLPNCPTCRGKLTEVRNIALEKSAATAVYPCKNREAGCEETLSISDKTEHLSECVYQSTKCPFTILSPINCPWAGILCEIGGHVRSVHGSEISDYTGWFEVKLQNFYTARRYCKAIFIGDKLFYLLWEVSFDTFYFAMFHVGNKKEAEDFTYEFKICKLLENISITGTCNSYLEPKWKVLRRGECVTLHYSTVQNYVNQNRDLSCEIEVRKRCCTEVNVAARQHYVAFATEITDVSENAWYE